MQTRFSLIADKLYIPVANAMPNVQKYNLDVYTSRPLPFKIQDLVFTKS